MPRSDAAIAPTTVDEPAITAMPTDEPVGGAVAIDRHRPYICVHGACSYVGSEPMSTSLATMWTVRWRCAFNEFCADVVTLGAAPIPPGTQTATQSADQYWPLSFVPDIKSPVRRTSHNSTQSEKLQTTTTLAKRAGPAAADSSHSTHTTGTSATTTTAT